MNRNDIKKIEICSALFALLIGTLSHFVYEWLGSNFIAGLFVPINESVWEHLKMIFFPVFLIAILCSYFFRKQKLPIFYSHFAGCAAALGFLLASFYTYSGILGRSYVAADIFLFVVSILLCYRVAYGLLIEERPTVPYALPGVLFFLLLSAAFFLFTVSPPSLGIFISPQ